MCSKDLVAFNKISSHEERLLILQRSGKGLVEVEKICDHHRNLFGFLFERMFSDKLDSCIMNHQRKTKLQCKVSTYLSQRLMERDGILLPAGLKICRGCYSKYNELITEQEDILAGPSAPPHEDPIIEDLSDVDSEMAVSEGDDLEDNEDPEGNNEERSSRSLVKDLLMSKYPKLRLPLAKKKFATLPKTTKYRINQALAGLVITGLEAVTEMEDYLDIYQGFQESRTVEKYLSDDMVPSTVMKEIITAYNHAFEKQERIRILTLLVKDCKSYSVAAKYNPPHYSEEDYEDDEDAGNQDEHEQSGPYFNPPLSYRLWRSAQLLYYTNNFAMCKKESTRRSVWRIDPQIIEMVCDHVLSDSVTNNVAFGTYAIKDNDGKKTYIAKTIREAHNAELVRQLQALIRENGFVPPGVSTLHRILSFIPATGGKAMSGINSTLERQRKAMEKLMSIFRIARV